MTAIDTGPGVKKKTPASFGERGAGQFLQAPSTYRKPCEAQGRFDERSERACHSEILRALDRIEARVLRLVSPDGRADNLSLSREYQGGGQ